MAAGLGFRLLHLPPAIAGSLRRPSRGCSSLRQCVVRALVERFFSWAQFRRLFLFALFLRYFEAHNVAFGQSFLNFRIEKVRNSDLYVALFEDSSSFLQ